MKAIRVLFALLCITSINGCSNDVELLVPENSINNEECIVIVDLTRGADSRLALSSDGNNIKSVWSKNDGFSVVKNQESTVHTFTITEESADSPRGVFKSNTTPTSGSGYNVYYPASITSENEFNSEISLRNQKQVGDGNMDHLKDKITMKHYVGHYSDIRFIDQEYSTTIDNGDGTSTTYKTPAGNMQKSTIWKLMGTKLPVEFLPVSLELEVSNTNQVTFYETNGSYYTDNKSLKADIALEGFDKDDNFTVYMVQSCYDVKFPAGATLRLTVRDANGECYYSDKKFETKVTVKGGSLATFNYDADWKRGNNPNYTSSGTFADEGKVEELQKAQNMGNGMTPINIVFMGDGFSDRQITDGTYDAVMRQGYEAFFSEEPFASFKDWFNVYYVVTASRQEGILDQTTANNSTFGTYFGAGTFVGGDENKVLEYTRKVTGLESLSEDALTSIVMLNSSKHAGTCHYSISSSGGYAQSDYGMGYSVSYFPIGSSYEALKQVLTHEANGHGFGKLADEYNSGGNSGNTADKLKNEYNPLGWHLNIDTESNPAETIWSEFYTQEYISAEGIGAYAGAYTWPATNNPVFYRPTDNSIMNQNIGGFNAPSREAIYIRIHKMVYGESWEYKIEEFKKWDEKNITVSAVSGSKGRSVSNELLLDFVPFASPVITFK